MTEQLHILALEPFYTGSRRLMLETIQRHSRHNWTILKLPGKRIERRLEAAAQWFAEVVLRRPQIPFDLLFTSEAINLPELFQLCPELAGRPVAVYFHDNQLPAPGRGVTRPIDHVNILTALEASEVFFNSLHHLRSFMGRAQAVIRQLPHFFDLDATQRLMSRSSLLPPPVEVDAVHDLEGRTGFHRDRRAVFVDLRNADTKLLADGIKVLQARKQPFQLVTIGPRGHLPADLPRTSVPEFDEDGATFAMSRCGTYLSTSTEANFDARAIMALASGMRAILPESAAYPELVPQDLHSTTLYQPHPEFLASALQDIWALPELTEWDDELRTAVSKFDADSATTTLDWKLATLAESHRAHQSHAANH